MSNEKAKVNKSYSTKDNKNNQKRNMMIAVGGIGAVLVILVSVSGKSAPSPAETKPVAKTTNYSTAMDNLSDKEKWMQQSKADIDEEKDQLQATQAKLEAVVKDNEDYKTATQQQLAAIQSTLEDMKRNPIKPEAVPPLTAGSMGLPPLKGMDVNNTPTVPKLTPEEEEAEHPVIMSINLNKKSSNESGVKVSNNNIATSQTNRKNTQTYLPTSFVKSKIITALDAPCGGTAADNPYPVLLNVTDKAQLPNQFRSKMKGCLVLAAAYGDIASERAYMRLEKLSCVMKNGDVIDMKVEGYVAGEDGKAGVKGRLVSKEGSAIAKALLAGFVGGLGSAFANAATTMQQTPIGPNQIISPQNSLAYAGGMGAASGFNTLSQYYINLAEKTYPIIEIANQRNVTIIYTQGIELPLSLDGAGGNKKSLPISVN